MELQVAIVYDADFNMQPYVGVTEEEVLWSILEVLRYEITEDYNLQTDLNFDDLNKEQQTQHVKDILTNPESTVYWDGPWVKFFTVGTHPRIQIDPQWVPDAWKIETVKSLVEHEYRYFDKSAEYDWERWEREATDDDWLELYHAHQSCEEFASEWGGRDTWWAVAEEKIWDGLIPRIGDEEEDVD